MCATAPLETIWEVDEELWSIVEPILDEAYPPKPTGRPRGDFRQVFNAVVIGIRRVQRPAPRAGGSSCVT